MKQLFAIGQAVTPVSKDWVLTGGDNPNLRLPKFGEIYHVKAYDNYHGKPHISLEEIGAGHWFDQESFSPVIGDSELNEALKEVLEEPLHA